MCSVCEQMTEYRKRLEALETKYTEVLENLKVGVGIIVTYSTKEAAPLIKRSAYTVSELCRKGKIKAGREGDEGEWIITANAINEYLLSTHKKTKQ